MKSLVNCSELALKKVKINGDVIGKFGFFEVEQTYINNLNEVLEVYYTFPISDSSTVVGFEADINGKIISAKCKEKKQAKKEYQENIVKGNSAYLMEQESDNVFRISVGKLDINEQVKIKIKYIDNFEIVDNNIEVFMPLLVKPKYKSNMTDNLQYGKVDYYADLNIKIPNNLLKVEKIYSSTHSINTILEDDKVLVSAEKFNLSKDFKLTIKLKEELSSNAISRSVEDGDLLYMSFMPEILDTYEDCEKDYIFLIDVSGSMSGKNIKETKNAVIECLKQLDEGDRFNVVAFESEYEVMNITSIEYNQHNLEKAIEYVNSLETYGGTEIFNPLQYILEQKESEKIILLFTDGQVGNEEQIVNYVRKNIEKSRLFPFGIDTSVNSNFINELAKVGNGKAEFIAPNEKIDDKIIRTFARIQTPLLEKVKINYGNSNLLDEIRENNTLFNFEFYNVIAKVDKLDDVVLSGEINGKQYFWKIDKNNIKQADEYLEKIYAREQIKRIQQYIEKSYSEQEIENYKEMIVDIAVANNINSKYTSFISVYERQNKIIDMPICQETTLDIAEFDCSEVELSIDSLFDIDSKMGVCHSLDIPKFLNVDRIHNSKSANTIKPVQITKVPIENIAQQVEEFIENNDTVLINILYVLYCIKKAKKYDLDKIIKFIKENYASIKTDELAFKLLIVFYRATKSNEIFEMFNEQEKKIAKSNAKFNFKLHELSDDDVLMFLEEDKINSHLLEVIWYLYNN